MYIIYFFQGEAGVKDILKILRDEFERAMLLAGNCFLVYKRI